MIAERSHTPSGFVIRRARLTDIESILEVEQSSPMAAHWTHADYATGCTPLEPTDGIVKALFIASIPFSGAVFAFAAFTGVPIAGEYELANMAVDAVWQRKGVASRLMAAGLTWCRSWGPASPVTAASASRAQPTGEPSLWLEVRVSNRAAIAFYEDAGFASVGVRTGYYDRPKEDAALMRRPLKDRRISGKLPQESG